MTHTKGIRLLALIGVLALVATACGGSKKSSTGGSGGNLAASPGFDPTAKTIHLGVITPLTGPVAAIGKPLTAGTETWFKYVNQELGGIGGKYQVILDEEDSQYSDQLGVQAYNKIKGNDVLIAQLLGTPVTKAVLPLLKQDNIVAAPASLDADWVRQPNLLPVGGPYQIQMINAADYAVNNLGLKTKTACTLVQDDAYGQAGQAGVDYAAKKLNFTVKTTAKFAATSPTNNTDFTAPINQLKSAGCQVVFLTSTPTDTGKAFATAVSLQFAPQWIGQSPTYIGALIKSPLAPYLQAHFLLASEGTEWNDRTVKGMADMVDRLTKYDPSQVPDYYFSFGYYQAWAVTQVLDKAVALGDLSRAGIIAAMNKVGTLKFDGLSGDYAYGSGPASRVPPRATTLFKINPAKPIGIEKVTSLTSDAAKSYTF
jgi:ABC-type branched-subunit amino acid transport system substrate-binding protein